MNMQEVRDSDDDSDDGRSDDNGNDNDIMNTKAQAVMSNMVQLDVYSIFVSIPQSLTSVRQENIQ